MADIKELAEELISMTGAEVEALKREMEAKYIEPDEDIKYRKEQEKFRRMYSNRRR